MNVERLMQAARSGTLASNDPDYQTLQRQASQGVQSAKNTLAEIQDAGGARHDSSVNRLI